MSNNCENKIKLSCPPDSPFANCVRTEVTIPEFSTLQNSCNSVQEVEEDMYTLIGEIKEEIDLSGIVSQCDTLPTDRKVASMMQFVIDTLCIQEEKINELVAQVNTQAAQIADLQANICA